MHKKTLFFAVCLLVPLGFVLATGVPEPAEDEPIVVGMELQYPPFEMSDPNGNPAGISVEIAQAFGDYTGRPVEIQNIEWTGLIPSLRTGKIDMVISSMTITEERAEQVDFSDPYVQSGLTLLVSRESDISSPDDLDESGRVIAVKSGTTGSLVAQEKMSSADIRVFDTVSACVLEVSQGKADAFIYDALTVFENWKKNQATTRMILEAIPGTFGYWGAAFPKNSPLRTDMNDFIAEFRSEGGFDEIADRHLGEIKSAFEDYGVPFFFDL